MTSRWTTTARSCSSIALSTMARLFCAVSVRLLAEPKVIEQVATVCKHPSIGCECELQIGNNATCTQFIVVYNRQED
eukprot:m.245402 g.245402  ORF g.245402 m.245402 type:complete len:77 (+) comp15851_c0_seq12:616-846(+)